MEIVSFIIGYGQSNQREIRANCMFV